MSVPAAGAVFLSDARVDTEAARRTADALRGFGVEVWFDRNGLRGGDAWDQKPRRHIKACAGFPPIILQHTHERGVGHFRLEWKPAIDRTHDLAGGRSFIVPVAIDNTREAAAVPGEFMCYQWTRLADGSEAGGVNAREGRIANAGGAQRGRRGGAGGAVYLACVRRLNDWVVAARAQAAGGRSRALAPRSARCSTLRSSMIGLHEGKGSKAKKPPERVFALRMNLVRCRPVIWRRLLVREAMWLSRLHDTIQIAFDWFDYQTHAFNLDDLRFGNPLKRDELTIEDDRDVTLADLDLEHRERFTYGYHFGEGWQIDIRVESTGVLEKGVYYPVCMAGERAGPPEDCGGIEAFHDMLACIKEPHTDLGREWLEWLGPDYDPVACDVEKINKALKKLGK